jgi:hypothetical protein
MTEEGSDKDPLLFMHPAHNGQNAALAATMGTSDQSP